jgi:predicted lipoprotein with Yx(FWY)xxD motif
MRLTRPRLMALGAILAIVASACSDDDGGDAAPADQPEETEQETLAVTTSDLGEILVDADGRTLYAFTPDEQGASTCYDDCAASWPALTVDGDPVGSDGVDATLLGTTERDDGSVQVTYGDWPLYFYSGDEAPGDTNGQEVGDVWYVVSPEGAPVESGAGEAEGSGETDGGAEGTIAVEESDLGQILVDARGRTLYAFLPDAQGASTCYDDCAANWPALTIDGDPVGGGGVDAALLGTAERDDGSAQLTYDGWPLYYFAADETRNDVNGQGVGDVWYVVSPDGAPIQ